MFAHVIHNCGKINFLCVPILYIFSNLIGNLIKERKITAVLIVKPFWNTNIFLSELNKCTPYNTFTLFFYTLNRNENMHTITHLHRFYSSSVHLGLKLESTQMPITRRIDTETVAH